jgi:hypothetical protein
MQQMTKLTPREWGTLIWRGAAFGAVVVAAGVVGAIWLDQAPGAGWLAFLVPGGVALAAFLGLEEYTRIRADRRLRTALDSYAEQEIRREQQRRTVAQGARRSGGQQPARPRRVRVARNPEAAATPSGS